MLKLVFLYFEGLIFLWKTFFLSSSGKERTRDNSKTLNGKGDQVIYRLKVLLKEKIVKVRVRSIAYICIACIQNDG